MWRWPGQDQLDLVLLEDGRHLVRVDDDDARRDRLGDAADDLDEVAPQRDMREHDGRLGGGREVVLEPGELLVVDPADVLALLDAEAVEDHEVPALVVERVVGVVLLEPLDEVLLAVLRMAGWSPLSSYTPSMSWLPMVWWMGTLAPLSCWSKIAYWASASAAPVARMSITRSPPVTRTSGGCGRSNALRTAFAKPCGRRVPVDVRVGEEGDREVGLGPAVLLGACAAKATRRQQEAGRGRGGNTQNVASSGSIMVSALMSAW